MKHMVKYYEKVKGIVYYNTEVVYTHADTLFYARWSGKEHKDCKSYWTTNRVQARTWFKLSSTGPAWGEIPEKSWIFKA